MFSVDYCVGWYKKWTGWNAELSLAVILQGVDLFRQKPRVNSIIRVK